MDPTPFLPRPPLSREEFAADLTRLREKADLTVRAVAAQVGAPGAHSTIGGWFAGQNLPSMGSLPLFRRVLHVCGVTDPAEIERWLERLAELRRSRALRVASGASPYRGLAGFEERHADWFFGRDRLRDVIVDRILAEGGGDVPQLLVGASGSGKSSLLRAGVLPVLRGEHGCTPLLLAPGRDPMRALACALSAEAALTAEWADLAGDPLELAARVKAVAQREGVRIVVAVDQLEEVFTVCPDPAGRERFLRCLAALPSSDVRVTGCLRADFYGQALDQRPLAAALQKGQTVVGSLSEDEIRAVVGGPAAKAGLVVDEGFIDVLLADLRDSGPGALPLLSHALLSTWERGRGTALTIADYRAGGGMSAAVSETAEEVYAGLSEAECARARQLFLRMVAVGDGVPDARRLLPLPPPTGHPDRAEEVYAVLERFVDRRLVTLDGDGARITHEALLTAWPRLRGWIDTDRAGQIVRQDLTRDADRWLAHGRDPSLLYRGTRLAVASAWARDGGHASELDALECGFLDASRLAEDGRVRRERRGARRLRRLLVLLSLLVVLSGLLTGVAVVQRRDAQRQQAVALSRLVAARAERLRGSDLALSAQLGLVAYRTAPTAEAREALMDASALPAVTRILAFRGVVQAVALSPDGQTLAAGGLDRQVALWDLRDPQRPRPLGAAPVTFADTVYALAFSPDGRRLAAGSGDGTVRVWEPSAPGQAAAGARSFKGPASAVYGVAFAPDGKTLAAAGADGGVYLWPDPEVPAPSAGAEGSSASSSASNSGSSSATGTRLTGFTGAVHTVAFRPGPGPGAALLAAGGADGTVRLWDLAGPGHPLAYAQPLTGSAGPVFGLAFTADGARLVAGSQDRSTRVWEVPAPGSAPAPPAVIGGAPAAPDGPASYVNAIACGPDGQWLATGSADNQVRLYDARTRLLAGVFPHPGPVTSLSFHPGGRQLVTAAADGTVRLWQLPPRPLRGFQGTVNAIGYAPDGKLLAVAGRDVQLWDVSDPWSPRPVGPPLTNPTGYSATVSFTPDGRTLAVGGREGKLWLWDLSRPDRPAPYGEHLAGGTGTIQSAAFDRTGRTLAVGSEGRTVRVWNTADPAHPQLSAELSEPTNYVYSVAFSPDGRRLAAGTVDKQVLLWRLPQGGGRPVLQSTLHGPGSYVMSVAFSPDSRILAAGTADRDVWLWDVSGDHPRSAGPTLTGPSSYVYALSFAPEGGTLAAASTDGTVWLWDIGDPRRTRPRTVLSGLGGKAYAVAYSPDGRSLAAGGAGPAALLWSRDEDEITRRLCERAGTVITAQEWAQLVPGLPYAPPCR
ncbi:WD40 repeat domain-containing protein [Streptomyces flavotricini]|uniref:WD40 repeat domain-containing protein n=1 Tax=Streptomyces flavotricini TaxID=66888 RepID=A0ABS8DXD2_9ACTN|nr:WD40 repeat domain-containing protein [Streptomyces flavotricini]MCC0093347.1 WD40 repeat domain-containing protein [Streptomyces flavotricini]